MENHELEQVVYTTCALFSHHKIMRLKNKINTRPGRKKTSESPDLFLVEDNRFLIVTGQ